MLEVDLSKPTLLCISDLEGCVANFAGKPQSQLLCKSATFKVIEHFLKTYLKFQVAFLGDYFDQGNMMEESITGIVGLKENTFYGNRVHIILGNRDINKMRICVEAYKQVSYSDENMWSLWKDFLYGADSKHTPVSATKEIYNPENNDYDGVYRCKQLLANTYGAPNLLTFAGGTNENEILGFARMKSIFHKSDFIPDNFVINCRKLFCYGELIKVIDVGGKKVLISHAGTNNANIFNFTNKNQLIGSNTLDLDDLNGRFSYNENDYFNSIEKARKLLQQPIVTPIDTSQSGNTVFEKSIKFYNNLYRELINAIFSIEKKTVTIKSGLPLILDNNPQFRTNYFLLQAMGLKADTSNTGNFLSPIESCGLNSGCINFNEFPPEFGQLLDNNGINAIAHGHIPFCGTVPLIHGETVGEKTIGVLSCDTSNGNRPSKYDSLDKIPLGYIQNDGIGIASINTLRKVLTRAETKGFKNDGTEDELYKPMVGHFNYEQLPTLNTERNEITYGTTIFEFAKGKGLFNPLLRKPPTAGGKSRRKRRRGSKRKSGKKHSRKIRKVRYLKRKCAHGCRH